MRYRFLALALLDLLDLADFYEDRQPGLGGRVTDAVEARARDIGAQPHAAARVRAPRNREIRACLVNPYLVTITYEVTATEVVILSVPHARSARRPWRRRLP
ncbi:type II toxin-antitoxin system RelE/ParE family toxin [Gemmata sp. G18]|uniref:Type II toxin-antitoxin system RelE/ParE family toxin n=1 Tax=Gemmata palustris TaxID=2822762 RepID=A0ABS5BLE2_9BACT|nr:type II toxin-antitoxin system RelE/ParE family toxin [Gemmata palustris]MBP3954514.1 type II toxin-antitoxin system RelE/ParE family toxin [Gemmata palustris]